MMSSVSAPVDISPIGQSRFFSINAMYLFAFPGRSAYFLHPLTGLDQPGKAFKTGFTFLVAENEDGKFSVTSPSDE